MEALFSLLVIAIVYLLIRMNPKLDNNYETKEKILWYNDPFSYYTRKHIVLWKVT